MEFFATRCMDELGRIVLPAELRKLANIPEKSRFDILYDKEMGQIVLVESREDTGCTLCGSREKLIAVRHKPLCRSCIDEIAKAVNAQDRGDE